MALLCCAAIPAIGQSVNSITIKDDSGNGIKGANVRLIHSSDDAKSKQSTGDGNGALSLALLGDGDYSVCIDNPELLIVDECKWRKKPQVITVTGGKTSKTSVQAEKGVKQRARVNDPLGTLSKTQTIFMSSTIAGETRRPIPMKLVRRNATTLDFELVIPADSTLNLALNGPPAFVSIKQGARMDISKSGAGTWLRVPKGTEPETIRVDVH